MIFEDPGTGFLRHISNSKLFDAFDDYGIYCPILNRPGKDLSPDSLIEHLSFEDLARISRDPILEICRFGSVYFEKKLRLRISEFLE